MPPHRKSLIRNSWNLYRSGRKNTASDFVFKYHIQNTASPSSRVNTNSVFIGNRKAILSGASPQSHIISYVILYCCLMKTFLCKCRCSVTLKSIPQVKFLHLFLARIAACFCALFLISTIIWYM